MTTKKHFRITYNYRAGEELHTGQCYAEKAMPQGTLFPIRYNPDLPHVHDAQGGGGKVRRVPLLTIGFAGSLAISLLWLVYLHGCS